jgi:hypothetical protein
MPRWHRAPVGSFCARACSRPVTVGSAGSPSRVLSAVPAVRTNRWITRSTRNQVQEARKLQVNLRPNGLGQPAMSRHRRDAGREAPVLPGYSRAFRGFKLYPRPRCAWPTAWPARRRNGSSPDRGVAQRGRTVLALRFVEHIAQTQVVERLGISQMHVSGHQPARSPSFGQSFQEIAL